MRVRYDSVYALSTATIQLIELGKLDQALRLIHDFVERIITEPLCTSEVFGSEILDALCQQIGQLNLASLATSTARAPVSEGLCVYIVSKVQKSGGHTRVIEDFIRARPDARHMIWSTELDGHSDTDYIAQNICKNDNVSFERGPKGDYLARLNWLQHGLLSVRPHKVYLFNHHQDSVAVAAIQPAMGLDAVFYHHGDHHLCLGVFLPNVQHIDPHPMGYHHCRSVLGIDNVYVPLTVDDKHGIAEDRVFLHAGGLTTCTAAKSNKVEIPYFVSYLDMVPRIILAGGGRHVHIGRLSWWALARIRRGLKQYGIAADRFIYLPWVASVWRTLQEYQVDLYIASFPYGGGLTLIEAMGAGIPVALHRHISSRILSCIELAYPQAFSWRDPEALLSYCRGLDRATLQQQAAMARLHYQMFHRHQVLHDALHGIAIAQPVAASAWSPFIPAMDERGFWMERQLSLKRMAARLAYRTAKKLRAILQP